MSKAITRLNPPILPDAGNAGYSQISTVEPGRLAFISGQVAWRPEGEPVPETLGEQTEIVIANAKAALNAIGARPRDIVMIRVYIVDLKPEMVGEAMERLGRFLEGTQPSLTGIGVASLAGPDLKIEMEMVVRLPD